MSGLTGFVLMLVCGILFVVCLDKIDSAKQTGQKLNVACYRVGYVVFGAGFFLFGFPHF